MSTVTSMQSNHTSSTILAIAIILLIPLAMWVEREENFTWASRLIFPSFTQEPNRHTPIISEGTFLPPTMSGNLTISDKQNPVILSGITTIPAGSSLTISKGVVIYAHEYAAFIVEGSLHIQGTPVDQVRITTNEKHPVNQVWAGIITKAQGNTTIEHARIAFASPAISCLKDSTVSVKNTTLEDGNTGIWQGTQSCTAENSTFKRIHDDYVRAF